MYEKGQETSKNSKENKNGKTLTVNVAMVIADIFPQAHPFSFRISKKFLNDHKILKRIRSAQLEKSSAAL